MGQDSVVAFDFPHIHHSFAFFGLLVCMILSVFSPTDNEEMENISPKNQLKWKIHYQHWNPLSYWYGNSAIRVWCIVSNRWAEKVRRMTSSDMIGIPRSNNNMNNKPVFEISISIICSAPCSNELCRSQNQIEDNPCVNSFSDHPSGVFRVSTRWINYGG